MPKINDAFMRSMEPPLKGNSIAWDDETKGFGARVTAAGAKAFVLRYNFDDPDSRRRTNEYRFTIGSFPTWSVVAARNEAKTWLRRIARGEGHPLGEKLGRRAAMIARREAETYAEAVEEYIRREQEGRRRNTTAQEVRRSLLRDGARWKEWPLSDITAAEIRSELEKIRDGDGETRSRPYLANRFFAYLSGFFRWAAEPGIDKVAASPMIGLRRPWEGEEARSRVFDDDEIKALWKAADALGGVQGAFLKLALLTGKRRSALASMRWDEISDDWVWSPPTDARRQKRNKRLHGIPLPALAQRVLAPLRGADESSSFVFPGRTGGSRLDPGASFQKKVRRLSGVGDFFLHAARHTVETRLAGSKNLKGSDELEVPPHIRDLLLDHVPSRGSGAQYDHYPYVDEMREALEAWAAHVEIVVSPNGARVLR